MRGSWRVKVLSGVSVLAIAGMSAAVSGAEQNRTQITAMQEESQQEIMRASEEIQLSQEDRTAGERTSQENIAQETTAQESTSQEESGQESTSQEESSQENTSQEESSPENTSQEERSPENTSQEEGAQENTSQEENSQESASEKAAEETKAAGKKKIAANITEEDIDAYFDQTVLVGDSVMVGFRNYAMRRANTYLGRIQFLASGSFSVHNALWPVNAKSVHPVYQGQKRVVWESLGMIQPKRIFLFFGLNDMNMGTLENTCATYAQVIANIKTSCPDAEIHLISMTYTLRGKGKGNLTNPNIRIFNEMLKQMARDNGWGFVDLANALADANGDLAPAYCSDNYVHQTNAAYDVWSVVLRDYARSQLDESSEFFVGEKTPEYFEAAGYGENWPDEEAETEPSERKEIFGTSINP